MQEEQPVKPANIANIVATNQGLLPLTMEMPVAAPLSVAQVEELMADDLALQCLDDYNASDPEEPLNIDTMEEAIGMRVERANATELGLYRQYEGVDYYFCGKGCYLDFGDDPGRYLDPSYVPSM